MATNNQAVNKGEKALSDLMEFLNGATSSEREAFIAAFRQEHRDLQTQGFFLVIAMLEGLVKNHAEGLYDDRNYKAVTTASKLLEAVKIFE